MLSIVGWEGNVEGILSLILVIWNWDAIIANCFRLTNMIKHIIQPPIVARDSLGLSIGAGHAQGLSEG